MHHEAGMVVYLDKNEDVVIYQKNADKKMYPGSITVLLTALVMVDEIPDIENTKIVYTNYANNLILGTGSVVLNLKVGEEISAKDALAALLVSSCGDAAYAIAEHVGGSKEGFAKLMNETAASLGMLNTNFINSSGLENNLGQGNTSTCYDLAILMSHAMKNETFRTITQTKEKTSKTSLKTYKWTNKNKLLFDYKYTTGGKTDYTKKAYRTLVTTATKDFKNLVITLNCFCISISFADLL
jgi:D-alanyl-D-alanine carboxypeptidase